MFHPPNPVRHKVGIALPGVDEVIDCAQRQRVMCLLPVPGIAPGLNNHRDAIQPCR